ncbi:MAG: hypothetical protein ACYTGS_06650 [Planctomycetota bacterium]
MKKMYGKIPTRMVFPSAPIPSADTLINDLAATSSDDHLQELSVVGAKSLDGNVGDALARTQELLRECRAKVAGRNPWTILDLLDVYPELISDVWVRETLLTLIHEGKLTRRRGRPFSSYKIHPLVVVGLVDTLIGIGEAATLEKAFYTLAAYKFLSYNEAKRRYYAARRDDRFKPIIMQLENQIKLIGEKEMVRELADAEVLGPGQKISRTVEDPDLGPVTITITATE